MRNSLNIPLAALSIAPILWVIAGLNGVAAQVPVDYDADGDGLIEIAYLEQLNAISWDLDGDGKANNPINVDAYSAEVFGAVEGMGCTASGCRGYELTRDLDFEDPYSYARKEVHTPWVEGNGWLPIVGVEIGDIAFRAVFDGNNHAIANPFIGYSASRDSGVSGLFGSSIGHVRRIGLIDVNLMGGTNTGGLAGYNGGEITGSFVTGNVSGESGVGGQVGRNTAQSPAATL